MSDRSAGRIPGYSFTDADGRVVRVPSARATPAATYAHDAMTREEALDIAIAFGVVTESRIPIRIRPVAAADGAIGWAAEVPLEFLGRLADVQSFRDGKCWM